MLVGTINYREYHSSPPVSNAPKQCRISSQSQASTKVVQGSHQFSAEYLRRTRVHQSSARPAAVGKCYKLLQALMLAWVLLENTWEKLEMWMWIKYPY